MSTDAFCGLQLLKLFFCKKKALFRKQSDRKEAQKT